jgi:hypothetical protein
MIKTFEQFILECYNPINEAFKSSKLREIIKKHGLPIFNAEKRMLYDLQDNEVFGVFNNYEEFENEYPNTEKDGMFSIQLKDGTILAIGNFGATSWGEKHKEFRKRRNERHKGNLGKYEDYDNDPKKNIKTRILLNKFNKKYKTDIISCVDTILDTVFDRTHEYETYDYEYDIDVNWGFVGDDNGTVIINTKIKLGEQEYNINIYVNRKTKSTLHVYDDSYDEFEEYNEYTLDGFIINIDEEHEIYIDNNDLNITEESFKDLFKSL